MIALLKNLLLSFLALENRIVNGMGSEEKRLKVLKKQYLQ